MKAFEFLGRVRTLASKFQFSNNNDKIKFTKLVDLYAKKDSKDQEGLASFQACC